MRPGSRIVPWQPIVGDNVFAHESGIHVKVMLKDAQTLEPFAPADRGGSSSASFDLRRLGGDEGNGRMTGDALPELIVEAPMEPLFGCYGEIVAFRCNDRLISADGRPIAWIANELIVDYRGTVRAWWHADHVRGLDGGVVARRRGARPAGLKLCETEHQSREPAVVQREPTRLDALDIPRPATLIPQWSAQRLKPFVDHDAYSDRYLRRLLVATKTVAVVGASPDPTRPSHRIAHYLLQQGYRVIPVNPDAAEASILGMRVHKRLADADEPIDLVDVFRRPEAVPAIAEEAIALRVPFLWMQLGVRNEYACRAAEQAGLDVVMNRCMKREHIRLVSSG